MRCIALVRFLYFLMAWVGFATVAVGAPVIRSGETIAFLGDSITEYGQNNPRGYVNLVMDGLRTIGVTASCVKAGSSGHKSTDMLLRLERDVLSKNPDWVVLSCGVNDVWHRFSKRLKGVSLAEYKKNITQILDRCASNDVCVIVLTATMIGEDLLDPKNIALAPYNSWLRDVARERGLLLVDMSKRMCEELTLRRAKSCSSGNVLTRDGVHMSPTGDEVMAQCLLESLDVWKGQEDLIREGWRRIGGKDSLEVVDPLIGTEGEGTQYGGMMPYTGVPFGSFQLVPMTRLNGIGRLSFNQADVMLQGFILTRQPAIWMGDWGAVRLPIEPKRIESFDYRPNIGRVSAGGKTFRYTATTHAAWICGDVGDIRIFSGFDANRDDAHLGYALPNFKGWRYVENDGENLKIGVSLISLEQAKENLVREIGDRTFEDIVASTRRRWEDYFSRIVIDAPEDVRKIFYTGLYHTLLYPRQIGEYGRYYSAFDDKIHDGDAYTCYSLWDTYRAEHPLLTLVAPERVDGMMQSLLQMYREGGWLPKWPNPGYTGIMIGAPAEVVLAEAYAKGFRGFDLGLAYEAVRKNAMVPQKGDRTCDWRDRGEFGRCPETRGGLSRYMELGYVACDETRESVSRTQDFGLADCAAAVLADATGCRDEASFSARAPATLRICGSQPRRSFCRGALTGFFCR